MDGRTEPETGPPPRDAVDWVTRQLAWEGRLVALTAAHETRGPSTRSDAGPPAPTRVAAPAGTTRPPADGWLASLAGWCIRRARLVLFGWLTAAGVLLAAGTLLGAHYRTDFQIPGSDSQRATNLIRAAFPDRHGDSELLVVHATAGPFDGPGRRQLQLLLDRVRRLPDVTQVVDPFHSRPPMLSADRRTVLAEVRYGQPADDIPAVAVHRLMVVAAHGGPGLRVGLAGQAVENAQASTPGASAVVGLLAAALVLLVGFGSAAAVVMALLGAALALGVGFGALALASHLLAIPGFTPQVASVIGLGVGIDYALLVLTRYRASTHAGHDPEAATVAAVRTAGRAVLIAGGTVVLALLGLYAVGLPFVHGMALGVILVVIPSVAAAVTLLPAMLATAGHHLDRWRPPRLAGQLTGRSAGWSRWTAAIQRRPAVALAAALTLLCLLAAPALSMRLADAQASVDNTSTLAYRAYALARAAFGPGITQPYLVLARLPHPGAGDVDRAISVDRAINATRAVLVATPGVATVTAPEVAPRAGAALFSVYAQTAPTAAGTDALLTRLRGPTRAALAQRGITIAVSGQAATSRDLSGTLARDLPLVLAAVIGTSLLLLLVVFRSPVVAAKAGLMNLLAIGAAFGVVVAVFQWGWGRHLIGVDHAGPVENFLPLLLFPTVFGLSMDYEVFLLSRIRGEWDRTRDNTFAVNEGLATTGRVVTAGAAIMVVLFGSLTFAGARTVKLFGLGLACAILLDALVVRTVLLPATMQLLGRANWWIPAWLERRLPRLPVEATPPSSPVATRVTAEPKHVERGTHTHTRA